MKSNNIEEEDLEFSVSLKLVVWYGPDYKSVWASVYYLAIGLAKICSTT